MELQSKHSMNFQTRCQAAQTLTWHHQKLRRDFRKGVSASCQTPFLFNRSQRRRAGAPLAFPYRWFAAPRPPPAAPSRFPPAAQLPADLRPRGRSFRRKSRGFPAQPRRCPGQRAAAAWEERDSSGQEGEAGEAPLLFSALNDRRNATSAITTRSVGMQVTSRGCSRTSVPKRPIAYGRGWLSHFPCSPGQELRPRAAPRSPASRPLPPNGSAASPWRAGSRRACAERRARGAAPPGCRREAASGMPGCRGEAAVRVPRRKGRGVEGCERGGGTGEPSGWAPPPSENCWRVPPPARGAEGLARARPFPCGRAHGGCGCVPRLCLSCGLCSAAVAGLFCS